MRPLILAALFAGLLASATGCVQRWLLIKTDPPGAEVYVDAIPQGESPAKVPFTHYGTREVMVRHSTDAKIYDTRVELVEVSSPWYQWFPVDLVTEFLWPFTIEDVHEVQLTLQPVSSTTLQRRVDDVAGRHGLHPFGTPPASEDPAPTEEEDAPPTDPDESR